MVKRNGSKFGHFSKGSDDNKKKSRFRFTFFVSFFISRSLLLTRASVSEDDEFILLLIQHDSRYVYVCVCVCVRACVCLYACFIFFFCVSSMIIKGGLGVDGGGSTSNFFHLLIPIRIRRYIILCICHT